MSREPSVDQRLPAHCIFMIKKQNSCHQYHVAGKKQRGQCIHKGRRKSEIVRDRIVLIHVIDLCISPRSAGETFLAEFLKKEQRFCARSSMHSAAGHGSISSSRRSSRRAGEMFSRFHTAQAGTVSFSSGIKVRFLLAGS